ncbi:3-deoxy-manno-octulosonate cytidylyltransferase [bacterium]|jgi:3-deoxy-manno-octulosonate cytidylyltransferase (CMP-KDO synthetase)|nr:3-deoxy-manno-octulosonate cytidylyltransferase [bacterium]
MKSQPIIAVIPARHASTRFPGKPLTPILGKPLLQWVWEGAKRARKIDRVIVATDDDRIAVAAENFGAETKKTRGDHPSGTDRIAEATQGLDAAWILNIQGDEPLIEGPILDQWISGFHPSFGMTTVATLLSHDSDLHSPDIVKVSFDAQGRALGFQRRVSPTKANEWTHQHVGLYAYTPATLQRFISLPPSPGEKRERLEQLRALENGIAIQVLPLTFLSIGVDTPGDVSRAERALANRAKSVSK